MTEGRETSAAGRLPVRAIWIVAALHVLLALVFANVTPVRESGRVLISRGAAVQDIGAPDERQHVNYVRHLRTEGTLPVFTPGASDLYETYQSHQPPLAYALGALWTLPAGDDAATVTTWLRVLNSLLGGVLVVVTGLYARRRAGALIGGLAAAAVAFWPMMLGLSGAWSNDVLLFLLAALAIFWLDRGVAEGFTPKTSLIAGLFIGLAILTKTTAVGLLPAAFVAWFGARRTTQETEVKNWGWAAFLLPLLIAAPIWLRNQSLYGDPLALGAFNRAFTGTAQAKDLIAAMGPAEYWLNMVGWWSARSFVGVFGYMDIWLTNSGLPGGAAGIYILGLVTLAGGMLAAISRPGHDPRGWAPAVFTIFVALSFLRFNSQYFQAQGRYLLPAILPFAFWAACGWGKLGRWRPAAPWAGPAVLLLISLYALARLPGEFARRTDSAALPVSGEEP